MCVCERERERSSKQTKQAAAMVNLKNSGRMAMARRWSRVRKSVEDDDSLRYVSFVLGVSCAAVVLYYAWQQYGKPSSSDTRDGGNDGGNDGGDSQ